MTRFPSVTAERTSTTKQIWCLPEGKTANVYNEPCPSRQALDRIADKWSTLITGGLSDGTKRFSELQRMIPGISQKMLTQSLRSLERDGLVERRQHPTIPPKVEYTLTPLGVSLQEVHATVRSWAESHIEEIETARLSYQARVVS